MDNKKYCPISGGLCKNKNCMWYVIGLNECSLNVLAQAADSQASYFEELGNEN